MKVAWEKVKGIYELEGLGKTPASAMISTGEIFINPSVFWPLTEDERLFILLHEAGHIILETKNESEVDKWATEQYTKMGGSLAATVNVFDKMQMDSPVRQYEQLKRVLHLDAHENGNINALNSLFVSKVRKENGVIPEIINNSGGSMLREDEMANFWPQAIAGIAAVGASLFGSSKKRKAAEEAAKLAQQNAEKERAAQERLAKLQGMYNVATTETLTKALIIISVIALMAFTIYMLLKKKK